MRGNDNNEVALRGHIIDVRLTEYQTPAKLAELREEIIELSEGKSYDILVDVGLSKIATEDTRLAAEKFFVDLPFRRFAIFGGSPPINLSLRSLVEEHTDSENVRIFRRAEDARSWLEENKTK